MKSMKKQIRRVSLAVIAIMLVTGLLALVTVGLVIVGSLPPSQVTAGGVTYDLDTHLRPVYYQDEFGEWQEIDNEFVVAQAPWDWQMVEADYNVKVMEDFTAGQIIEFEVQGETIRLQPMALEWTNDLAQIQPISMPVEVAPVITNPEVDIAPGIGILSHQGTIRWNDAYGEGVDFEWKCIPTRLLKILEVEDLSKLATPEQYILNGGNASLRLNLIFDPSAELGIYVDDVLWDKSTKVQTLNVVEFRKDGETLWNFMPLAYWDSGGSDGQSVATLEKSGNKLYISIVVPYEWLQSAVFPVFIDADVAIETSAYSLLHAMAVRSGPFWTSPTVGYVVFIDSSSDLKYRKTSNGGATWAAAVNIRTGTVDHYDCWADWQTAGDAGTKIHIAYHDNNSDDVRYVYLDTSGDSVGGDDQIVACQGTGAFSATIGWTVRQGSITKTRGGNLVVAFYYQDSDYDLYFGFYTSPDATTWTSRASPYESVCDTLLLFPGNAVDNQDVWGIFWDKTADAISLKTYDNSGNSWSEQAIASSMADSNAFLQMDGVVRLSDGHLILAAWNLYSNAAADLKTWDINGAGSITAKTNVITNEDDTFLASVFINQDNDDIYVAYGSGTIAPTLSKIFYKKSTDGAGTWGSETAMQADAEDDTRWVSCGAVKAANGGKFQPFWLNDDLNDLFCNSDNGISIAAAPACTPSIEISVSSWSVNGGSPVDEDTLYSTGLTWCTITNNSGGAVTITVGGTDMTGGDAWDLSDDGSNGDMIYGLYAGLEGGSYNIVVKETAPYNTLKAGLADSGTQKFGLQLETPTVFDDGNEKSGTVVLTTTCD